MYLGRAEGAWSANHEVCQALLRCDPRSAGGCHDLASAHCPSSCYLIQDERPTSNDNVEAGCAGSLGVGRK